jgi:hypothetical protein
VAKCFSAHNGDTVGINSLGTSTFSGNQLLAAAGRIPDLPIPWERAKEFLLAFLVPATEKPARRGDADRLQNGPGRQMLASMQSSVMVFIPSIGSKENWGFMHIVDL